MASLREPESATPITSARRFAAALHIDMQGDSAEIPLGRMGGWAVALGQRLATPIVVPLGPAGLHRQRQSASRRSLWSMMGFRQFGRDSTEILAKNCRCESLRRSNATSRNALLPSTQVSMTLFASVAALSTKKLPALVALSMVESIIPLISVMVVAVVTASGNCARTY